MTGGPRCAPTANLRADFPVHVQIEPMPGCHMMRVGEHYLFTDKSVPKRYVDLTADLVAAVLEEIAVGRVRDHSLYGLGELWRFCSMTATEGAKGGGS